MQRPLLIEGLPTAIVAACPYSLSITIESLISVTVRVHLGSESLLEILSRWRNGLSTSKWSRRDEKK